MPSNITPSGGVGGPRDDRAPLPAPRPVSLPAPPNLHPRQEPTSLSVYGGTLGGTAIMISGLVLSEGGSDVWLGTATTLSGLALLVRGMICLRGRILRVP